MFFSATINVTYPAGFVCTATDGVKTLTAPDTSGTWECVVPNAGTWNFECVAGSYTTSESVIIDTVGQTANAQLKYYIFKDGIFYSGTYGSIKTSDNSNVGIEYYTLTIVCDGSSTVIVYSTSMFDATLFEKLTFFVKESYCTLAGNGYEGDTYFGMTTNVYAQPQVP